MGTKTITGIVPGIIFILILIGFFVMVNTTTNKSSSNYDVLKDYMSADNIKTTLDVITKCGITGYDIVRDDSLDSLDGENTLGFRLKSQYYNAVMYIKDGNINSIRFADNDLYRNGTLLKKIDDVK